MTMMNKSSDEIEHQLVSFHFCLPCNFSLQEYGVAFMETSAKTGMNVELAFMAIAR